MARQRAHRPPLAPAPDRETGVRHVLQRTLPGRLIVVGLSVRLSLLAYAAAIGPLPTFLTVVDTVAGLAIAIAAGYFLYRLFVIAKRRLLWRVRRELSPSLIFFWFGPGLLIVSVFLL